MVARRASRVLERQTQIDRVRAAPVDRNSQWVLGRVRKKHVACRCRVPRRAATIESSRLARAMLQSASPRLPSRREPLGVPRDRTPAGHETSEWKHHRRRRAGKRMPRTSAGSARLTAGNAMHARSGDRPPPKRPTRGPADPKSSTARVSSIGCSTGTQRSSVRRSSIATRCSRSSPTTTTSRRGPSARSSVVHWSG
jgi:hypothetical protein